MQFHTPAIVQGLGGGGGGGGRSTNDERNKPFAYSTR